jgi:hypothetical protein
MGTRRQGVAKTRSAKKRPTFSRPSNQERGLSLRLVLGDVLDVELPPGQYDLVHVALLIEYVEPLTLLRRIHEWLSTDATLSLVTQEPMSGVPAVSRTNYESLQALAGHMIARRADHVEGLANQAGFRLVSRRVVSLPTGKSFVHTTFKTASTVEGCGRSE